jgi:cell division protein FtsL
MKNNGIVVIIFFFLPLVLMLSFVFESLKIAYVAKQNRILFTQTYQAAMDCRKSFSNNNYVSTELINKSCGPIPTLPEGVE